MIDNADQLYAPSDITLIPIAEVRVINPRARPRWKLKRLMHDIETQGLKKPVTVRQAADGPGYELACGQGRLEACHALGYDLIPAFVRDLTDEDVILISLIENMARRTVPSMELIRRLGAMRDGGATSAQIAKTVQLTRTYVSDMLYLLDHGEERLICRVEQQRISLTAAMLIARQPDQEVQLALAQAYEEGLLGKRDLQRALRVADLRRAFGPKNIIGGRKRNRVTRDSVVEIIRKATEQEAQAIRRVELCEKYLALCHHSLRAVLQHEDFVALLRNEGLHQIPATVVSYLGQDMPHAAPIRSDVILAKEEHHESPDVSYA